MSGSDNTPSRAEISRATDAFLFEDAITESQLESIKAGETTLEQARQSGSEPDPSPSGGGSSGGGSGDDSQQQDRQVGQAPSPPPSNTDADTDTDTDSDPVQRDPRAVTPEQPAASPSGGGGGGSGSGGGSGGASNDSEPQTQQSQSQPEPQSQSQPQTQTARLDRGEQGVKVPGRDEVNDTIDAALFGDGSEQTAQRQSALLESDVNDDGRLSDADARALAARGQYEKAQALEKQIDQLVGTEGDGTPDSLTAPTVDDVLGDNQQVDSAAEADALAEAARQSSKISQERADELLDEAAADEQGTVTNRDTDGSPDKPGSTTFSRFDIAPPGGSTNPALGERTSVDGELILDRRGNRGRIESISINGQEVEVTPSGNPRPVGPPTERGGDAATDRLVIDLPEGINPGVANISIRESFGPQENPNDRFYYGTETTEIEALITEDAPTVENQAFREQFQGSQTADEVQNAVSGAEAEAILGEEVVDELGGQQEAAAAVSRELQGRDSEPDPQPQSSPTPPQQQQSETQESYAGEAVVNEDGSLTGTPGTEMVQAGEDAAIAEQSQSEQSSPGGELANSVGSVTREREDPTANDDGDDATRTNTNPLAGGTNVNTATSGGTTQTTGTGAGVTSGVPNTDVSTIVGADTALANAAERQQRNRFEQEIDFTPGVEGDPIESTVDDVTQSFAIGAEEAAEETAQRQLDAVETLFGESQRPPSFTQRTVDDFYADTSETVAETPSNLADAPEQIAGVVRDIGITAGVAEAGARGADREQDIDQAQSRNRQRLQSAVDQATETAENVAQNPSEIGGVAGAAGVALAGGAASAKAVNVVTRGRLAGGDLTYKVGNTVATKADDAAGRVESKAGGAASQVTDSIRDRTPPVSVDIDPDAPAVSVEDSVKQGARNAPSDLAGEIQSRIDALRDNRATKPNEDATADEVLRDLGDVDDTRQPAGPIQPPETRDTQTDSGGRFDFDIEFGDNRASKPGGGTVEQPDVIDDIGDIDDTRQPAGPERPPETEPSPDPNPLPSQPDRDATEPQTGTTPGGDDPDAPPGMTDPMRDPDTDVPQRDARERYGESPTETGPNPNPLPSTPRRDSTRPTTITAPTDDAAALPGLGASDALGRANLRAQLSESAQRGQPGVVGQSQLTASDAVFAARDRVAGSLPSTPGVPTTTLRGSDASLTDLTVRIGTPEQRRLVADDPTDDGLGPFPDDDLGGSLGRRFDDEDGRDVETRTRDGSGQQSVFRIRSRRDDDGADVRASVDDNRRGRRDRTPISDVGIAAGAASATESRFADVGVGTLTDNTDTGAGVTTGADVTTAQTPLTTTDITPAVTPGVSQDAAADVDANLGSRVDGDVGARFDVGNRNRIDIDSGNRFDIDNRNRVDIDNRNRFDIDQRQDVDTDTPIRTDIDNTPERRFENRGMRDRERDASEAVGSAFAGDEKRREYELRELL